jgi:hypothetical protein
MRRYESASGHLKAVAFVDGEQVLTLVSNQAELLVNGTKDHRTFIRNARVGEQAVRALDLADDDGCAARQE